MAEPIKDLAALPSAADRGRPMGALLHDRAGLETASLLAALGESAATGHPVERVAEVSGLITPETALAVRARQLGMLDVDRDRTPPDPALGDLLPPEFCLAHRVLPWMRIGSALVVGGATPEGIAAARTRLGAAFPQVIPALALERDIETVLAERHAAAFARAAETAVAADQSCRDLNLATPARRRAAGLLALGCAGALALAPTAFFAAMLALAVAAMLASQLLKLAAALAAPRAAPPDPAPEPPLPVVSLLVPLFREAEIAATLVARLKRLTYPRVALDVVLVLEAGDTATAAAIARAELPPWMRVIEVPEGTPRTKPRALNYAARFARGSIVGVLDAEDAPAANQLERVVARFAAAPPEVACLQGVLDFYNPHANWLSRMFTVEYATWFRLVLPGLARLGFALPLGGTTVYFRRAALEAAGGWDAHNVTEDADLGIRLARHGYRTELLSTVTLEEANNRLWPWVRQRSRWLKGYMMTWAAHSRHPLRLRRDLGTWKCLGMQLLFLGAVLQALLAPLLWSFWLILAGLPHPALAHLGTPGFGALVALFLASEGVTLAVALMAVARSRHRGLKRWVPTLALYFPLTVAAAWKAAWELLRAPFYWDKTAHGASPPDHDGADRAPG